MSNSTRSPEDIAQEYIQPVLLDSCLENLSVARRWLRNVTSKAGMSDKDSSDLLVAVGEAITNCIKHAYRNRPGGKILVSHSINDESLTIHIRDWGIAFRTESYAAPDLSKASEGGYGVFLMHEMADGVEIRTDREPGTEISLTKNLCKEPDNSNR